MGKPLALPALCCTCLFANIISLLALLYVTLDRLAVGKYTLECGDLLPDCGPR